MYFSKKFDFVGNADLKMAILAENQPLTQLGGHNMHPSCKVH